MKPSILSPLLSTGLALGANCSQALPKDYDFGSIQSSSQLKWTPCSDSAKCAMLQVPLDYNNKSAGTTSMPLVKISGKNATDASPSIIFQPGGPGGSGIEQLLGIKNIIGTLLGEEYNFVSYDPRGVANSSLRMDCFSGNIAARAAFNELFASGVANASSEILLQEQYYSGSIYGDWCNNEVATKSPHGYYITTVANARDLLTFIEAEAELANKPAGDARMWMYAVSYGTVLGTTFASMFPDRVERMILDGVLDPEYYYNGDWSILTDQENAAFGAFTNLCHSAGKGKCAFWADSPAAITARLDALISNLESNPVPINGINSNTGPALVTIADLKTLMFNDVYDPLSNFPVLAEVLHQVEQGNVTALINTHTGLSITDDAGVLIRCVDSYTRNKITSLEAYADFAKKTTSESKFIGDIIPLAAQTVLCRGLKPELPDDLMVQDANIGLDKETAFPILFASNTIDPLTTLKSAERMNSRFPDSVLLKQEAVGHTVALLGGSDCYFAHVQGYLAGILPDANTTCAQQNVPFINPSPLGGSSGNV